MRRVLSLLAASLLSFSAIAAEPAPTPAAQEWIQLAEGQGVKFDILRSSIEIDPQTFSVEFVIRTTYDRMVTSDKAPIEGQVFVERAVALCRQGVYVTMSQLIYDAKNQHTHTIAKASVYDKGGAPGTLLHGLMTFACQPFMQKRVTPDTKRPGTTV